jgi:hypothetical protein
MNEFKFSCPNCQQNIQATPEYSGAQINCPSCQQPIIVPQAPSAPVPHAGKLTMAASTTSHAATRTPVIAAGPLRKKKDYTNLIVGLVLAAGAISAGINFGPGLYAKYIHHAAAPVAAGAPAEPTNEPPPPPPELTTDEIMQKLAETYKGLTSLAIKGTSVADIDPTQFNSAAKPVNSTATVALQMGRPGYYRMEWERTLAGMAMKGAAWNSGKGDFVGYDPNPPGKVKNRQTAITTATAASAALCELVMQLFFSDTNNLTTQISAFTRTNGTAISDQDCYILAGELPAHTVLLWVSKSSFLIRQIEFDYGGKIDPLMLKSLPLAQRDLLTRWSKLKGKVVETYDNVESDRTLGASAFESPYTPTAAAAAAPRNRGGQRRGPPPGGTTATQLTRRVTQQPEQQPPP